MPHLLVFALGFLLSHDEHDPCGGNEREGQDGEDGDEKRLNEVEEIVFFLRLWRIRLRRAAVTAQHEITITNTPRLERDNIDIFICLAAFGWSCPNPSRRGRLNE